MNGLSLRDTTHEAKLRHIKKELICAIDTVTTVVFVLPWYYALSSPLYWLIIKPETA